MWKMWCFKNKEAKLEKHLQQQEVSKVKTLLSRGANPDEYSMSSNCSFLSIAITQRNEALVRLILKAGASSNQSIWDTTSQHKSYLHEYPLQIAAMQGHLGIVKALIEHGADVNIGQDSKAGTPLHQAAKHGHKDVVTLLMNTGADIIAIDRSLNTPLHRAASYGYQPAARALLQRGAPINARNCFLSTPLHSAASMGASEMVKLLLSFGADSSLRDVRDKRPVDLSPNSQTQDLLSKTEVAAKNFSTAKNPDPDDQSSCRNNLKSDDLTRNWKSVSAMKHTGDGNKYWEKRRFKSLHQQKRKQKSLDGRVSRTQSDLLKVPWNMMPSKKC